MGVIKGQAIHLLSQEKFSEQMLFLHLILPSPGFIVSLLIARVPVAVPVPAMAVSRAGPLPGVLFVSVPLRRPASGAPHAGVSFTSNAGFV